MRVTIGELEVLQADTAELGAGRLVDGFTHNFESILVAQVDHAEARLDLDLVVSSSSDDLK